MTDDYEIAICDNISVMYIFTIILLNVSFWMFSYKIFYNSFNKPTFSLVLKVKNETLHDFGINSKTSKVLTP